MMMLEVPFYNQSPPVDSAIRYFFSFFDENLILDVIIGLSLLICLLSLKQTQVEMQFAI